MIKLWYNSDGSDIVAKKKNKKIADLAKLTIKEMGYVEVWSSKTKQLEAKIKDPEKIEPYWSGIDFELYDEIDPTLCEKRGIVKEIIMGKMIDTKHENQEIDAIDRIII